MDDSSAGDLTRARLAAGLEHRRHRLWSPRRTALVVLLPLIASTAVAATVVTHALWTRPLAPTAQPVPPTPSRAPSRPARTSVSSSVTILTDPPDPAATIQVARAPRTASEPAHPPAESRDADLTAYGAAHRAHFGDGDWVQALRLWNSYLRGFPNGRFVPEATYNRAITLLRLDRRREAIAALRPLAAGRFDGYRQVEAQALLESLPTE
jgi:hypothetical protein